MELVKTPLLPSSSLRLHKMKKRQVVLPPTPDKKQTISLSFMPPAKTPN
jgi:hypothetical protein